MSEENEIRMNSSEKIRMGRYANYLTSNHTQEEVLLDFYLVNASQRNGDHVSRIIVSPAQLKRMAISIKGLVDSYEKQFGKVTAAEQKKFGFSKSE